MDETGRNLQALFGLAAIILLLVFGVKAFCEWLNNRNIVISKLIESRVIKASGETGFATFDSVEIDGQTLLILDRGNGLEIPPVYFRPKRQCLAPVSGNQWSRRHCGPPIDVGKYQDLPRERQGFFFSDGESVTRF
jgi:hypothetical protein